MKKFFSEFKKFITRGNVVDMAVGVIVGSSFTAIVNGLSNYILKPIINWLLAILFGADSLKELYTYLKVAYDEAGEIDAANSIFIDWGSFINAVINFFLIALVLFTIVKIVNKFREERKEFLEDVNKKKLSKEQRQELKAQGIKLSDRAAVKAYLEAKAQKEAEAKAAADAAAAEKARLDKINNPSTEELLKQIRDLLAEKK